jgi:hypothetical protein
MNIQRCHGKWDIIRIPWGSKGNMGLPANILSECRGEGFKGRTKTVILCCVTVG